MSKNILDSFGVKSTLVVANKTFHYFSLPAAAKTSGIDLGKLPFSLKILLENLLRRENGTEVKKSDIEAVFKWDAKAAPNREILFMPARVLLQDFTGVPAVADLAAMRSALKRLGGDPAKINPFTVADLVIDHSVQVDQYASVTALKANSELEYARNKERYQFLRWGQNAFDNFRVVPPDTGIVHQVNLEYLAKVAMTSDVDGETWVYPDTLIGTDSHTTMINGLGVVGWGVGGIEAEAALLGQPSSLLVPQVIGVILKGRLPDNTTATDLVLTITETLRKKGVVGKFVEFFGSGLANLTLADRATIANMAPEYGATIGLFPVDEKTTDFLKLTGRGDIAPLVEAYYRAQDLWYSAEQSTAEYTSIVEIDLSNVEPSLAGPSRPQDRVTLSKVRSSFRSALSEHLEDELGGVDEDSMVCWLGEGGNPMQIPPELHEQHPDAELDQLLGRNIPTRQPDGVAYNLCHGSVVIAAITSCTNTSNPSGLMTAALLARNAVHRGLKSQPWVKTSLAPGSRVVTDYLDSAGLLPYMEALGFHVVGYGCTTCIGNSGPLHPHISDAITEGNLSVAAVLSGNRNFEGRVNPLVRANYLASPALVIAFALAGNLNVDLSKAPVGIDSNNLPVYLDDIWPSPEEVAQFVEKHVGLEQFENAYHDVFKGEPEWNALDVPSGELYSWKEESTYIKEPPFFATMEKEPAPVQEIKQARVLALLGDSVTTDHISPAGSFTAETPAGKYLVENGVAPKDFNSYGARRGNHEVMMRGTFANIRLRNLLAPGTEGGFTRHQPEGEGMTIYEASMKYQADNIPLIIIAGKEYGTGSSRDWAAKGPKLLGINAVIAESYERIHRSNLIGMGILPLQFSTGESAESLGLNGTEAFDISGLKSLAPGQTITVTATSTNGESRTFSVIARIDTANELEYFYHGGILPYVLRQTL